MDKARVEDPVYRKFEQQPKKGISMRIKEEIKQSGIFWLPSERQRAVPGSLSILDGGNIKLELTEPLDTSSMEALLGYSSTNSLNQILGDVEKDGPVVIDRCYYISKQRNIAHSRLIGSDIVSANRALIGLPHQEETSSRFNAVSFSVEGIDNWVGISGIEVDYEFEKGAATISYEQPSEIPPLKLSNGMQLSITFAWTPPALPSHKEAKIAQKTFFRLTSQNARELDEFTSVIGKVTAFLCFIMNEIVCLETMTATADNLTRDIGNGRTDHIPVKIYCSSWPYSKDEPEIDEFNMLFKFTEVQNRAETMINKWIENYEQIAPAFDLYFCAKTEVLPSWNMQFLSLVQALEAFHRRTSADKYMEKDEFEEIREKLIQQIPKKHRNWFGAKLQYANELSLRNRFKKMTDPFDRFMCGDRRKGLIDHIVNTRNYLTHYDSSLESKAAKGRLLKLLCLKMNALFRLHFLQLVGFDEHEINSVVDKCPNLKGECNL